jgi:hypothetical protein
MWLYGFPGWWGIGMMILMVLFWGGIITLIIWTILRFTGRTGYSTIHKQDSLDIGKE